MIAEKNDLETPRQFIKYSVDFIEVGLETSNYKILGKVPLYKNKRFSDSLNDEKVFIVLRDARVFSLKDNKLFYEKEYLMVNKNCILLSWEER